MPDEREIPPPDAPPTDEERARAERLRDALEDPSRGHDSADAELARALKAAWSPRDLPAAEHGALVQQALARRDARRRGVFSSGVMAGRVVRVTFGAGAALAVAAAVLLLVWGGRRPGPGPAATGPSSSVRATALAVSRSTQALFTERFAPTGGQTARIDRIAVARGADLRDNEFAKWGVR